MKRGQASIEALIVTLAFFSVMLALSPAVVRASEAASFASAAVRHEAILDAIYSDAKDAFVLGEGNSFSFQAQLPTDAELSFEEESLELVYAFELAGRKKNYTRGFGFPLTLSNASLPKGELLFETRNDGAVSVTGSKK